MEDLTQTLDIQRVKENNVEEKATRKDEEQ